MGRASPSFWLDSWLGHHESLFDRCKTGAIVIHVSNSRGSRMEPADRQEQIVRVAATHLSRDGAAGVSMSSIAKDAGVTRALIYRYFPGKQALLDAVLRHESERLLAATEPDPKLSARDNLHRSLNAYLDFFSASSGGVRELYTASANPVARELVEANHELQATRILQVLELDDTPRHRPAAGWRSWSSPAAASSREPPETTRSTCASPPWLPCSDRTWPEPHSSRLSLTFLD